MYRTGSEEREKEEKKIRYFFSIFLLQQFFTFRKNGREKRTLDSFLLWGIKLRISSIR